MRIALLAAAFDPGAETGVFLSGRSNAGAAVTFTGLVRASGNDPVTGLEIECYPELAEAEIGAIATEAMARFALIDLAIIHRHGTMLPGEPIMQVMTLAAHRRAAFEAADMLMDYLKTDAPFWKKEHGAWGERWVAATPDDDARRARWRASGAFPE